jgi:hypothetical protein
VGVVLILEFEVLQKLPGILLPSSSFVACAPNTRYIAVLALFKCHPILHCRGQILLAHLEVIEHLCVAEYNGHCGFYLGVSDSLEEISNLL